MTDFSRHPVGSDRIRGFGQQHQGYACARDVSRFCRAADAERRQRRVGCLQTNRARISKACQKSAADHGQ